MTSHGTGPGGKFAIGDLDPLTAPWVRRLQNLGIKTTMSCDGTAGHRWNQPTIWFTAANERAAVGMLRKALRFEIPIDRMRRTWTVVQRDGIRTINPDWYEFEFILDAGRL